MKYCKTIIYKTYSGIYYYTIAIKKYGTKKYSTILTNLIDLILHFITILCIRLFKEHSGSR